MKKNSKSISLKSGKEKAVLNRHPWIFSGALKRVDDGIELGDQIAVKDHHGAIIAHGHWCGHEGLVCRITTFGDQSYNSEDVLLERCKRAQALRLACGFPSKVTNGYRLIHGEGDGLSGLVVDVFHDSASIQSSNPGFDSIMPTLCTFLHETCELKNIYYQAQRQEQGHWLLGHNDAQGFLENGLQFAVNIADGQKTGHFLDQRENRALVKSFAKGRVVLDAFSYSGGFSVYAASGGARLVTSLDISQKATHLAEQNMAANNLKSMHKLITADCFNFLRTVVKDEYDLIILDPPAFAKSAHSVMRASRGYKDINLLAMKAVRSGGLLFTFSCSHHVDTHLFKQIIFAAAKDADRDVRIVKELSQGVDHPVSVYCPQSQYLKGLMLHII